MYELDWTITLSSLYYFALGDFSLLSSSYAYNIQHTIHYCELSSLCTAVPLKLEFTNLNCLWVSTIFPPMNLLAPKLPVSIFLYTMPIYGRENVQCPPKRGGMENWPHCDWFISPNILSPILIHYPTNKRMTLFFNGWIKQLNRYQQHFLELFAVV